MTLIEKFEPYVIRYTQDDVVGYLESDNVPILEYQEQCEKIAEDFAIGFGQWMTSGVEFMDETERGRVYYFKKKLYITKELLEIYKKYYETKNNK